MPAASELVVKDAVDAFVPEADSVCVPIVVAPSENVILPVGAAVVLVSVTVAVKVMAWPALAGLREETSVVPVARPLITCESEPLLALKFPEGT